MRVKDLYNAIGNSSLSPDDECVVVESELGVVLETVVSVPSVVLPPAPEPAPVPTPLEEPDEPADEETDG